MKGGFRDEVKYQLYKLKRINKTSKIFSHSFYSNHICVQRISWTKQIDTGQLSYFKENMYNKI